MKNFVVDNYSLDDLDKKLIQLTQNGLPICERPYLDIANNLSVSEEEITKRLKVMAEIGFIRKNAIATNHYKLGYLYNAMSVWEIAPEILDEVGQKFQSHSFISHCYERPKIPPKWNYNLFAMVHGKTKDEVLEKVELIKESIDNNFIAMDLIYSTKILKKTGIRLKRD